MRIGILSSPMLFQRDSHLQQQVRATIHALLRISAHAWQPMTVGLFDPHRDRLDGLDVLHVFSATHGNGRLIGEAAERALPVVLTPLIGPGWNGVTGGTARAGDDGLGSLTGWNVQSGYAQMRSALQQARLVVALGDADRQAIAAGFLVDPAKVRVFPNGISPHLFDATGALFRMRTGISGPFALMAGPISPYANALAMARTVSALALPLVLVGEACERDQDYLRQVRAVRGVTCLGGMDHDPAMLASAYAAASVLLVPGHGTRTPAQVCDALAAGTPVIMNPAAAPALPDSGFALHLVRWDDPAAQQQAISALLAAPPPREAVRTLVRTHTWQRLADQIAACYAELGGAHAAGTAEALQRPGAPAPLRVHALPGG